MAMIDLEKYYCEQLEKDWTDSDALELIELITSIAKIVYRTDPYWTSDTVTAYKNIEQIIKSKIKPIETEE